MFADFGSISGAFIGLRDEVVRDGRDCAPRGTGIREIGPVLIRLRRPRARLLTVRGRPINPRFAAAETAWVLGGGDDPWIFDFNRNLRQFADDGVLMGAYGPRLRRWAGGLDQLGRIVRLLRDDRDSRRGVIQIFDPARVDYRHRDVPCTVSLRFAIRDDALQMTVHMRANDLWLGFPYDVFLFTCLQEIAASILRVRIGPYHHFVDSFHIYDRELEAALACERVEHPNDEMAPFDIGSLEQLDDALRALVSASKPDIALGDIPGLFLRGRDARPPLSDIALAAERHWRTKTI